MSIKIKKLLLVIFIFLAVFSPPIIPGVRLFYVLSLFSLVVILLKYRKEAVKLIKNPHFFVLASVLFGVSLYAGIIAMVGIFADNTVEVSDYIVSAARLVATGQLMLIIIIYLLIVFKKMNLKLNDVLRILLFVAMIQAIIALLALVFPWFKDILVAALRAYTDNEAIHNSWVGQYRLFGFAGDMFDHFGHGMGLMTAVPLILAYRTRQFRYLCAYALLIIPVILNARTGIVIATIMAVLVAGYIIYKLVHLRNKGGLRILAGFLAVVTVSIVAIGVYVNLTMPAKIKDAVTDFRSIAEVVLTGQVPEYRSTAKHLFGSTHWTLPDTGGLILGTGHSVYGVEGYDHSDVGYVNDIWLFGAIVAIAVYVAIIVYTWQIRHLGGFYGAIALGFILSFFVYQFKGTGLWSANLGIFIHILLIAVLLSYSEEVSDEKRLHESA